MTTLVDSVEFIEHTFPSSATLTSGTLASGVNISN